MTMTITAERRGEHGKEASKRVRDAGKIPAVFYGHGVETTTVSVDPKSLSKALANPKGLNGLFGLNLDGSDAAQRVFVRELQRHPVSRNILHIDLVAPNPDKELTAVVPLRFTGRSIGVSTGGRMRKPYREVNVRALPDQIPGEIVIDVTNIDQGDAVYASQLDAGQGSVVYDRDFVIVKVAAPRGGNKK